ncbi:WD40/YVTN/BNR-like repeat-containing protein [Ilumatobacter nonamiensis]|uniref:WD40/YVTN/BNR-like repeat-containing protein n=1 Tax=Ilumatobacter nonamiensis TaxID=467093 RepID=UPI00034C8C7B|nr:sialidase family protein [Ilumatobacter nonamiensis]
MSTHALIGTRKGLFTLALGGASDSSGGTDFALSEPSFAGVKVANATLDARDGTMYALLDHGHFGVHLQRSDDGGSTWTEIAAPEYPPKPNGEPDINPMTQNERTWTTELGWILEPGHAEEPNVLWCGTIPGGLFRSDDRGDSWQLVQALWDLPARKKWFGGGYDEAGIHSICVDPRGPGRLVVGVSCGGAWRTDDGGATWSVAAQGMRAVFMPDELANDPDTQDPHRIVRCPTAPDMLWTQHHCGIFRSRDNGDSWTEITEAGPSTFGFAVAVHPTDPDTAWFVPAISDEVRIPVDGKLVVTRTRDGGESFDVLTNGLPQQDAYDLVYRHAFEVDETGEQLLMASTTGSLWWSGNAGDDWHRISANLPPIASVQFCTL